MCNDSGLIRWQRATGNCVSVSRIWQRVAQRRKCVLFALSNIVIYPKETGQEEVRGRVEMRGWEWATFWALHIAIKFCLAKILTCLCHIIRNRKQQARSSFPSLSSPSVPAAPATRSIKSCPCQLVWQFSALIFLSVCLCFSFSSLNENLLFSQAFPRVSSASELQWDNFTVIIGCCSLCRIRTCLCGFVPLLLLLVFVLCLSNLNFLKINFYLPKIKP